MLRGLNRDSVAGAMFIAIGAGGLITGRALNVGTADAMGEGYVPLAMCWLMIALGALIVFNALRAAVRTDPTGSVPDVTARDSPLVVAVGTDPEGSVPDVEPPAFNPRPLLAVTIATLAFALLLEPLGIIVAVFASSLCASKAMPAVPLSSVLLPAALLSLAVLALFVWGLGLPLHALPRLGG